jgi:predicted MPP superfamily phosphohydrolase
MKNSGFAIFLGIVLVLYGLINFYILKRGYAALSGTGIYQRLFLYGMLVLIMAYPVGRFVERVARNGISSVLIYIGSFYLGIMVYAFFMVVIIDFFRLGNHFFHFFPDAMSSHPQKSARISLAIIAAITLSVTAYGHWNALHTRIRQIDISIPKPANGMKNLNIVMASDIHLGTIIRNSRLIHIVEKINSLNPDLVLLPGDIVDEDVNAVAEQGMSATLKQIHAKYGVYAITGNHEYFGGVKKAVSYIEKGNVIMLQDSLVKIADSFYLIGRKDLMAERFGDGRKTLDNILNGVDRTLPLILMDHQPFRLETARKNGIDLQISGHTHHGQLWPFNFITEKVYEISWGYAKIGNTHYYVSSGAGTWGPPLRTGNVPEIVNLKLNFGKN